MPTTYTTNLKLAKPATGELSGTWGDTVNNNITSMIEEAVTGRAALSTWASNAQTITTSNGITSSGRCLMLDLTGALSATGTLTVPAVNKFYIVRNGTTGGFAVTVTMGSGTTVSVPNGDTVMLYVDGTNIKVAITTVAKADLATLATTATYATTAGSSGAATTNANMTGPITGTGNVTSITAQTGTGTIFAMSVSPTLTTPTLNTATINTATITSATLTSPTLNTPTLTSAILGTPQSATLTNATGLPATGVVGTAAIIGANAFTGQQTFAETKDTVYTITDGAGFQIDPVNGNIQVVTLGASRTPAATNFEAGQCILLGIDDGTAYTITWSTVAVTWVKSGGSATAPGLATSGYTWVVLWKQGSTVFGTTVGSP